MNIEEAEKIINRYLNFNEIVGTINFKEAIDKVLKELKKKDKIIDLMAERISSDSCTEGFKDNIEQVKQHFYKKAEDM